MSEYEQMRDQESGSAGQAWREADRQESELRNLYESLREDNRYTEEHKEQQAWGAFLAAQEKIVAGRQQARESLQKQARSAERFSVPLPKGVSHQAKDASELLAAQNEAGRIVRKVERQQEGPISPGKDEALKGEYGRGLELGGVEGAAICRGVLGAAEERGVPVDAVVDGYRKDHHRESLERAQLSERMAASIGKRIKEPPFPRPADVPPQSLDGLLVNTARRGYAPQPTRAKVRPPWMQ